MHLINKKTDSNITDALLLYTVVTKPTYWVNCHLCLHVLPKIQLSTCTGKVKQFPKPFLILPFFVFFVTISLRLTQIKIILRLWLLVRSTFLRRNKSHSSVSGLWLFIFHWICICRIRPQSPLLHRDWPFMFHSSILQTKRKNVNSIYITKC